MSFRVGAFDADFMEKEFFPTFAPEDLVNLNKYNAYIKLMINGITSRPFSMQTSRQRFLTSISKRRLCKCHANAMDERGQCRGKDRAVEWRDPARAG